MAFTRLLFSQKISLVDVRLGSKYTSQARALKFAAIFQTKYQVLKYKAKIQTR